jgi:hypothetical protein
MLSCNHLLHVTVDSDIHVTFSASITHFGLVDNSENLQMHTTIGNYWEELKTIITTTIGTSFPGPNVAIHMAMLETHCRVNV